MQELHRSAPERLVALPLGDEPLHPPQQRPGAGLLRFDVDLLVVIFRIDDGGQEELLWIRFGEAGVSVGAPLHRRPHAIAVAEVDVVAHPDLVAVIDDRRSGKGEEQAIHQVDAGPVVLHQRRETPPDPQVDAGLLVGGVGPPHVVAVLIGDHLQRQLVVVAEKQRPLAVLRDLRRLRHDVDDREAILLGQRHVHPGHDRKVEGHVAFVAVTEVRTGVFRPLIGLSQQHLAGKLRVEMGPQRLEVDVRLRQVLAGRSLALVQIGNGVETERVHPEVHPELEHFEQRGVDRGVVKIQVRLMGEEAVPVVSLGHRIPRPVRGLVVLEDDAGVCVLRRRVAPDIEVAPGRAGLRAS